MSIRWWKALMKVVLLFFEIFFWFKKKNKTQTSVKKHCNNLLLVNTLAETMFFRFIFIQFAKFEGFFLISSFKKIFNIKLVAHFCIFSYQAEGFSGCYDKLYTTKWFDFCKGKTLRIIFMWWLTNVGRWVTIGGS